MYTQDKTNSTTKNKLQTLSLHLQDKTDSFLGYPVATDFDFSELYPFFNTFLNNIGDPMVVSMCGLNTQEMEREVIDFYSDLLRAPKDDSWGYVTGGSTEGNLYGLWTARERYPNGLVFYSKSSHYSIAKNVALLRMEGIVCDVQPTGEIDYDDFEEKINAHKDVPVIIVANIGTTMTEARDDIRKLQLILKNAGVMYYHIHCDAALAGSYARFIQPDCAFDFEDGADTIAVSPYKFLGVSIPCGVALVRDSIRTNSADNVAYIASPDSTISGSRSGHTVLMIWYRLQKLKKEGVRMRYERSLELAAYAQSELKRIGWMNWRNEGSLTVILKAPPEVLIRKWQLASQDDQSHILCMPGVSKARIDAFIADLTQLNTIQLPEQPRETAALLS